MTPDFRALCAELLAAADEYAGMNPYMRLDNAMKTARAALAAEPEPPADGDVAELVAWLRNEAKQHADSWPEASAKATRLADFLERLAEPELVGPSDDELLKLTENISTKYLCKHKSLPSDWDPGDYASSTKGLIEFARAVLARWGKS
jgi:hypothetical protein